MRAWLRPGNAEGLSLLVILVGLSLALSACRSESGQATEGSASETTAAAPAASPDTEPESPPAGPSATAPPATPESEETAVLAAYQAYWDTYFRANQDPPQATYEDLERVAAGAALETVRSSTFAYRQAGRVFRRPPQSVVEHRVEVLEVMGDTAMVRDCYFDDAWVETVATGERTNEGVGTQLSTAQMVREGGAWKVSTLMVEQSWEGVAGCAVE